MLGFLSDLLEARLNDSMRVERRQGFEPLFKSSRDDGSGEMKEAERR
jgi:hypothetical protein